ncbi:MAG: hypothetical protein U1F98_11570 [Verrucomicrobiota bacterium]
MKKLIQTGLLVAAFCLLANVVWGYPPCKEDGNHKCTTVGNQCSAGDGTRGQCDANCICKEP